MRFILLLAICCAAALASPAQDTARLKVYFAFGSHELTETAKTDLQLWAENFHRYSPGNDRSGVSIPIRAYTDSVGSPANNRLLAERRAYAVAEYLARTGIPATLMVVVPEGEVNAPCAGITDEGCPAFRYAEVYVKRTFSDYVQFDKNRLYELLHTPGDTFCIDPYRDTVLAGTNGTVLVFKGGSLNMNGVPCSCVQLVLHEYYSPSEIVLNNLNTVSDGRLLESAGMIKMEAWCNNKPVNLKPNAYVTVMQPADTILPGMRLFSASRSEWKDPLNWRADDAEPDFFDAEGMRNCLSDYKIPPCPLFFCRIRRFINRLAKSHREKQLNRYNDAIDREQALLQKFELSGETMAAALQKSASKKAALKYYLYRNYNWDYRNIDRYKKGLALTSLYVKENETRSVNTDVKLIYAGLRTIVPATLQRRQFAFTDIFARENAWLVGLEIAENDRLLFAVDNINTSDGYRQLVLQPGTPEQIKEAMRVIDTPR